MSTIPITLTPQEIAAYEAGLRQIVRVAVECPQCEGTGYRLACWEACLHCHGTGHLPNNLGEPGDVLVHASTLEQINHRVAELSGKHWEEASNTEKMHAENSLKYRLTRVGDARLVSLQDTTEDDARLRVESNDDDGATYYGPYGKGHASALVAYRKEWDLSNPNHPWASNPWVWVAGVERQGGV